MHWIVVVEPLSSSPLFRLTGKSILASPSFSRTAISQSIEARIALAPRMGKFQLRQKCEKLKMRSPSPAHPMYLQDADVSQGWGSESLSSMFWAQIRSTGSILLIIIISAPGLVCYCHFTTTSLLHIQIMMFRCSDYDQCHYDSWDQELIEAL